ncbi:MAG: 30S ribosomal protein S2, partial [Candidatus Omnitrophica bacterium]|nr:30S ribosomal protein S2 [Candidatus Omnitrophota bacterium]
MPVTSEVIRKLLENGTHFGHQTNKWNPKMKKFIFDEKSGIYIIDLEKTEKALQEAADFLYDLARNGGSVLFVGTKKQAKQIIKEEAGSCGMFYVNERWLGGCLTNFSTIRKSVDRLDSLQEMKGTEVYEALAKKEKVKLEKEEAKLLKNLIGIRGMKGLPGAVVIIDTETENIAVKEAGKIGIPIVALIDTNCDPDVVEYPIPGNDDAIRSIRYICHTLAEAVDKGRCEYDGKGAPAMEEEAEEVRIKEETEETKKTEATEKTKETEATEETEVPEEIEEPKKTETPEETPQQEESGENKKKEEESGPDEPAI